MEGAYKTKLSESQLEQAMRNIFDEGVRSYSELTHGWANSAYAIELSGGKKVVLKARPSTSVQLMRCEVDTMKAEVQAMRRLSEADAAFPTPEIYAYDDSLELLPVEYFVMAFLEGTPYNQIKADLSEQERNAIEFQLGELNRRINEVRGDEGFGFYAKPTHSSWRLAFADMIGGVLTDGKEAGIELSIPYEDLKKEIERRLHVLDEVTEPRLVHWDLWDGNVFVKDGRISGIVDFERAMWGDPLIEHYFGRFNTSVPYREGYGLFPTGSSQLARIRLYDLYLDLILHFECPFRKYDNEGHIKWTRENLEEGLKKFLATE